MGNEKLNSLTPDDIYTVPKEIKNLLNKILSGRLSSIAFVRENEFGDYEIKPATHSDKKLLIKIFKDLNLDKLL